MTGGLSEASEPGLGDDPSSFGRVAEVMRSTRLEKLAGKTGISDSRRTTRTERPWTGGRSEVAAERFVIYHDVGQSGELLGRGVGLWLPLFSVSPFMVRPAAWGRG